MEAIDATLTAGHARVSRALELNQEALERCTWRDRLSGRRAEIAHLISQNKIVLENFYGELLPPTADTADTPAQTQY